MKPSSFFHPGHMPGNEPFISGASLSAISAEAESRDIQVNGLEPASSRLDWRSALKRLKMNREHSITPGRIIHESR